MEVWALRPHAILVKVISVCRVHVFFHQYVADLREERSENVLRTVSASPFIFAMTVSSTSGVITTPPEGLPREVLPLTTEVNILYGVNTGTPFVVPPALDIERPVMQVWALRPHAILVKVISVCRVHVFFHQYVADLREERSENLLRTVSASPFIFDMAVSSTSGVITTPPEGLPREVLPLPLKSIFCMVSTRARRSSYHRL